MPHPRCIGFRLGLLVALWAAGQGVEGLAQLMEGRVDVVVVDPSGRAVEARVEIASRSPQFVATARADAEGRAILHRIPPGIYRVTAEHAGFETAEQRIEVRSSVPQSVRVVMEIAALRQAVTVAAAPLFDPLNPSPAVTVGRQGLDRMLGTTLGRSTVDVVTTMPGWLLEANAVLHPRGSEYDTQYVIDGMPVYDNRSIAFAPAFENSEFEAVNVRTAGIPAEYGRRLGGVIALDTRRVGVLGHHSDASLALGSYGNRIGALTHQYNRRGGEFSIGMHGGATERYLDPPSLENFTNKASAGGGNVRFATDLKRLDRLTFYGRTNRTGFLVPNDLVQQEARQRQDRRSRESAAQVHYQGALSASTLVSVRGMVRDLSSELWSNPHATPVYAQQDRGLREGVVMADLTVDGERHTLKVGGDVRSLSLREQFQMAEPDELPDLDLDFRAEERGLEASAFVQDAFRIGNFAASAGLRLDRYRLLVEDTALSPRLAASYFIPRVGLQVYASYDRIFQPPPTENLLLSSAGARLGLGVVEGVLAVPASRANFFEAGLRKPLGDALRLDVKHYWRSFRNSIDDDVFLNTGLSFPITFDSAQVEGTEVHLEMPRWRGISAVASYANMLGVASSPVTGGLFIQGGEALELLGVSEQFPISQDQRNTVAAMVRFEIHPRAWVSVGARYGSGLPVELEDDDDDDDNGDEEEEDGGAEEELGQAVPRAIQDQVDLERGRVRPNLSLDFSVGALLWRRGSCSATLQFDIRNLTDRLNVINFTGLFSGTALAPGRQATVQLRARF